MTPADYRKALDIQGHLMREQGLTLVAELEKRESALDSVCRDALELLAAVDTASDTLARAFGREPEFYWSGKPALLVADAARAAAALAGK